MLLVCAVVCAVVAAVVAAVVSAGCAEQPAAARIVSADIKANSFFIIVFLSVVYFIAFGAVGLPAPYDNIITPSAFSLYHNYVFYTIVLLNISGFCGSNFYINST